MGQWTFGILYGIEEPSNIVLRDDEYRAPIETRGLFDRWEHECKSLIEAHEEKHGAWTGTARYVPDTEADGEPNLVGFFITAGASGKVGLPSMNDTAIPFSAKALREDPRFARAYRNARRRWNRFAKWATAQGVTLDKPRVWLTGTEVA